MINLSSINLAGAGGTGGGQAATPNVDIFGAPVINGSQVSGFTTNDYLQMPRVIDFSGKTWQLDFKFTTGANVTTQQNIVDSGFGLAIAVSQGKMLVAMSSNGTSWDLGAHAGTHAVAPNTSYYVRMTHDGQQYVVSIGMDGKTYETDITVNSTASLFPRVIIIGKSTDNQYVYGGSINLADAVLRIDGEITWTGMNSGQYATKSELNTLSQKVGDLAKLDESVASDNLVDAINKAAQQGGGGSEAHTHEQVVIICSASTFYQWHGLKVIITEDNGKKHELELDETGETIGYVKLGVTYTITFPVVQGLLGHDDMTFTAEHYVRNVKAVYRYQYGDLRDVARSFVVEASSSSLCELTGNEDVIDEILSHGSYVIDENTKKYARLSEENSGFFADGTPWDGTYGNAFRYLPKIYILHDNNHVSGGQKYWVSNEAMEGAMELPESWIGMYKGAVLSGVLRSIPNVFTTENKTMSQFWTDAQQNSKDYGLVNYFDHQKLNALHLAKFGDMNSDNTVGIGLCNAGAGYYNHKTGTTAALGNGTGASQYLSTGFQMVRLFGIEDLFGTTWEFRPNIRFDGSYAIVYEGNIVSNTAEGRQFVRLQSASGAYIRNMALGDTFDLVPTNASGASQSTYWCDGVYAANTGQLLRVGGASHYGSICGLSCANSDGVFTNATAYIGARLAFKGDISEYSEVSGAELAALQS